MTVTFNDARLGLNHYCGFRMLQPHELKRGQDFTSDYVLHAEVRDLRNVTAAETSQS